MKLRKKRTPVFHAYMMAKAAKIIEAKINMMSFEDLAEYSMSLVFTYCNKRKIKLTNT